MKTRKVKIDYQCSYEEVINFETEEEFANALDDACEWVENDVGGFITNVMVETEI